MKFHHSLSTYHGSEYTPLMLNKLAGVCMQWFCYWFVHVIWKWSSTSRACSRMWVELKLRAVHNRKVVLSARARTDMSCASVFFFVAAICSLQFRLLLTASVSDDPATPSPGSHRCPPVDGRSETCVCQHDKGIIDVTPLANDDGTAKYVSSE